MVERYVDELRVNLVRYDGMALAANVLEGWAFRVGVGEAIDRDHLIDELQDSVAPEPFFLDEKYGLFSWGADAAYLEIVIGVMGGLPGLLYTVDKVMSAYQRRQGLAPVDLETAQAAAVSAIASARKVSKTVVKSPAPTELMRVTTSRSLSIPTDTGFGWTKPLSSTLRSSSDPSAGLANG